MGKDDKAAGPVTRYFGKNGGRVLDLKTVMLLAALFFGGGVGSFAGVNSAAPDPSVVRDTAEEVKEMRAGQIQTNQTLTEIKAELRGISGDHTRRIEQNQRQIDEVRKLLDTLKEGGVTRREFEEWKDRVRKLENK